MGTDGIDRDRRRYVSYLLRLWQTERGGTLVWRASLESAHSGEQTDDGQGPRYVLKRVSLERDWIMRLTEDHRCRYSENRTP